MVSVVSQWNVSPKTTSSGNPIGRRQIHQALEAFSGLDNAYFKFVILEVPDIDEVCHLVGRYDLPAERIILMPEGATPMAIRQREKWLAEACAERGFRYSTRLHIMLWGAQRGQ
jgi:organic radical activating enzyme